MAAAAAKRKPGKAVASSTTKGGAAAKRKAASARAGPRSAEKLKRSIGPKGKLQGARSSSSAAGAGSPADARAAPQKRQRHSLNSKRPAACAEPPAHAAVPELVAQIIERHRCPITKQLVVEPVMAEDGHIYEGSALKRWMQTNQKSPVTSKPMGSQVVPAVSARQTIGELVSSGVVDDKTQVKYFLARGQLRATRSVVPGPDLPGAHEDLAHAASLNQKRDGGNVDFQQSVVDWMMRGVQLCSKSQSMSDDTKRWVMEVGNAVRFAVTWPLCQRMTSWLNLPEGTCVRVIDDPLELEQLCERPAPGASAKVKWNPDMRPFAGKLCVVKSMGQPSHMNYVLTRAGASFSFPYDALFLLF